MDNIQTYASIAGFVTGLVISTVTTAAVRRWALRHGFVDRPGGHKAHGRPVALLGGASLVAAVLLPMLAALAAAHLLNALAPGWLSPAIQQHLPGILSKTSTALAVIAGGMALHVLGLLDDMRPLGAAVKLTVQVVVAAFVVLGCGVKLLTVAGPVGASVLSILWIVTLTNAFNFLDNMDGLATGVGLIVVTVFAATALQAGQLFVPTCCWLLVGALAGFLPYNLHPATIFLGDAGSLVLGYLVAVFTILTTFYDAHYQTQPAGVLAPLVVMAVPLYDTASVMYLRWRSGVSVWRGDRRHFSHRLAARGLSVRQSVAVIWLATAVTAFPALLLPAAGWLTAAGLVCQTLGVVILVAFLEKAGPNDARR